MIEDETPLWEQMEGEPDIWYRRFTRFRLMSPVRRVAWVYRDEEIEAGRITQTDEKQCPRVSTMWYDNARQWNWEARASAWDKHLTEEKERQIKEAMTTGYATPEGRVTALKRFAETIYDRLDNVSPKGKFPVMLLEQWRGILSDLAEETGGRIKKQQIEHSGEIGTSVEGEILHLLDSLTARRRVLVEESPPLEEIE